MSVATLSGSQDVFLQGRQRWPIVCKQPALSSQHILQPQRKSCRGFGRSLLLGGRNGCRVRVDVLARDGAASSGTMSTVVGSDLIVLGFKPDAVVSVAPVGATDAVAGPQSQLLQGQAAGDNGELSSSTFLVATEAMVADGLLPVPVDVCSELRVVAQKMDALPVPSLSDTSVIPSLTSSTGRSTALGSVAMASAHAGEQDTSSFVSGSRALTANGSILAAVSHPLSTSSASGSTSASSSSQTLQQATNQQNGLHSGLWQRLTGALRTVQWGKLWALALLSISYVHQATTGFALPAMLPMISNELHLTDLQGALLTTGYSYLYAIALVPIGLLADRVSRPKLLAAGLALWSILTCTASTCRSFGELILARVGFAAAQGAQNPVCFSLIPELFPVNKSTALSLYNCAIYVGRALSFAAVLLARHLHDNDQAHLAARGGVRMETRLDHLDRADLHSLSIMHTAGDMAAATPDREFNFPLWEYGNELPDAAWRQVLRWIAVPGFLIGLAMIATLQEPRMAAPPPPPAPSAAAAVVAVAPAAPSSATATLAAPPVAATAAAAAEPAAASTEAAKLQQQPKEHPGQSSRSGILGLLRSAGFMSVTLAAALNDVGSYALIAWQSTFYERVYGLESSAYAPVLAALLPIGGILGGVGGGYLADRLTRSGRRVWVTAGATLAAAPCLAASCLAPTPELSYAALMVGFGLSEMWRAPSAVMARGIAPPSMGSTASALYLCVRNLVGGLGPLLVAGLIGCCGLQQAMLVVPAMYLASGLLFAKAEGLYDAEMLAKAKEA